MSFLDNLRDRLSGGRDEYYDDDYYDDYDEGRDRQERYQSERSGVLGNTRRPEAESVSVRTRSGHPVSGTYPVSNTSFNTDRESIEYSDTGASAPMPRGGYIPSSHATYTGNGALGTAGTITPGDVGVQPIPRMSSGALPPYVLRPASYDDVQTVVRRVKTNQPVILSFVNTNIEVAKRILDFSFGLTCGIGGKVEELGDRTFAVLPLGASLSQTDLDKLAADGVLVR